MRLIACNRTDYKVIQCITRFFTAQIIVQGIGAPVRMLNTNSHFFH